MGKTSKEPTEKSIENAILVYLNYLPRCYAWKVNNVGIWDAKRKIYRKARNPFIINGISDINGVYMGRFLAIEVKTPKRRSRVSESQEHFLKMVTENGGIGFVATSIEDVRNELVGEG